MPSKIEELALRKSVVVREVAYSISYGTLVVFSESLVLFALVVCVVTALLFQFDEVLDRDCDERTPNVLASISSVTGISPQYYIWRVCIALHSTPRIVMIFAYYNLYMDAARRLFSRHSRRTGCADKRRTEQRSEGEADSPCECEYDKCVRTSENNNHVDAQCDKQVVQQLADSSAGRWQVTRSRGFFELVVRVALGLNAVELASLLGVTYISNRDNYTVHEKLFELFGICHLFYAMATLWLMRRLHEPPPQSNLPAFPWTAMERKSYATKRLLAYTAWLLTVFMTVFFIAHTAYCVPYGEFFSCYSSLRRLSSVVK